MSEKPTFEELRSRLGVDVAHYKGQLPERVALVWYGYIAALFEWSLISLPEYDQLIAMLPQIPENPVVPIFLGRGDET
ncbi:MAG: hypothetical protein QOH65_680 [Methylobacteriaceae bacterium]|jgi:hypothetical protein|nr:hypothetical protein [Methylobacteriaceae bacterium]